MNYYYDLSTYVEDYAGTGTEIDPFGWYDFAELNRPGIIDGDVVYVRGNLMDNYYTGSGGWWFPANKTFSILPWGGTAIDPWRWFIDGDDTDLNGCTVTMGRGMIRDICAIKNGTLIFNDMYYRSQNTFGTEVHLASITCNN